MVAFGEAQKDKAIALLSLHTGGGLLILPNVWSPIGARILQARGYPAVATASAAVSSSLGYRDGERIKRATMVDMIGRIARSVDVPVTADIESGYGRTVSELEETVHEVISAGIVGINLEDQLGPDGALRSVEDQCQRIAAVREVVGRQDLPFVINARVDSYLSPIFPSTEAATEEAVSRAWAYSEAGADCIYPIGPGDEETVRVLRTRIDAPLNILGTRGGAPLPVLEAIGINRVSFGPFVFRACLRKFVDIADALLDKRDYSCLDGMLSKTETEEYLFDGSE